MLHAHKSLALLIENGKSGIPTVQSPVDLDSMLTNLTLHQIKSQGLFAELLQSSELRSKLKHHVIGHLNTDLLPFEKVEKSITLFAKADDSVTRAAILQLEKTIGFLPLDYNDKSLNYILEVRKLLASKPKLQEMFNAGSEQFADKVPYANLPGVNELTEGFGHYFMMNIHKPVEVLSVLIKHLTLIEFVGCLAIQLHMVSMVGGVLFFKFALSLLVEGNFLSLLRSTKYYILAKFEKLTVPFSVILPCSILLIISFTKYPYRI
jgi:hypothetical protein